MAQARKLKRNETERRAAIYARTAVAAAEEIEAQVAPCRRYAAEQGWRVVKVYEENGLSGAALSRPGLQAAMSDAGNGEFDILLAATVKRLSRNAADLITVREHLRSANVKLATLHDDGR